MSATAPGDDYYVPAAFAPFADQLQRWFAHATCSSQHSEIEGKIGVFNVEKNRFDSVVPAEWFHSKLQHCMAPGARWDRVEEETTTSYLFENGVRGVKKEDETATFVLKVRKSHFDFAFDGCKLAARLTHSLELPKQPPCAGAKWVRLRRRKSFYSKYFRFDFSFILEGRTYQEAKRQQLKHEIEIEFLPQASSPDATLNFGYLAMSLLFKLQDMVTPNGTDVSEDARAIRLLKCKYKDDRREHPTEIKTTEIENKHRK